MTFSSDARTGIPRVKAKGNPRRVTSRRACGRLQRGRRDERCATPS